MNRNFSCLILPLPVEYYQKKIHIVINKSLVLEVWKTLTLWNQDNFQVKCIEALTHQKAIVQNLFGIGTFLFREYAGVNFGGVMPSPTVWSSLFVQAGYTRSWGSSFNRKKLPKQVLKAKWIPFTMGRGDWAHCIGKSKISSGEQKKTIELLGTIGSRPKVEAFSGFLLKYWFGCIGWVLLAVSCWVL